MTGDGEIEGTCHCGDCRIRIPRFPDHVVQCNCSLCRTTGWRGIYFAPDEVEISGAFDSYVRSDLDEAFLRNMRCRKCGTPTHWELLSEPPHEKMGVNANLFDPELIAGLQVKKVDGASW